MSEELEEKVCVQCRLDFVPEEYDSDEDTCDDCLRMINADIAITSGQEWRVRKEKEDG